MAVLSLNIVASAIRVNELNIPDNITFKWKEKPRSRNRPSGDKLTQRDTHTWEIKE